MIEEMNNFNEIMDNLKKALNIKSDTELAQKLGFSRSNYSERKQRNSIPYENLIILCKKENISIDKIIKTEENINKSENYKDKLAEAITKLNEREATYFYFMIETKLAEKEL